MTDRERFSEHARQVVHIAVGAFALLLRYLTWWQAGILALAALAFNAWLLPRLAGHRIFRPGERHAVAGILYYLARKYPAAQLWPDDIEDQAHAIAWMSFIASTLHPARRRGADHALEVYGIADRRLGEHTWVFDRFSIVDIHLFRLYWRLAGALGLPPSTFPHLAAHHGRMMQRPAVQKTSEIESQIGYELPDWFPAKPGA